MNVLQPDHAGALLASDLPEKEVLASLARPAIAAHIVEDDRASVGCSRYGDLPDLPSDMEWPKWNGKSLKFIAQVNCSEIPLAPNRSLLPSRGMLYFFYGAACSGDFFVYGAHPNEQGAAQVIFRDAPMDTLARRDEPPNLPDDAAKPLEMSGRMRFTLESTFPDAEHPVWERLAPDRSSWRSIWEYACNVIDVAGSRSPMPPLPRRWHQILGHAAPMQTSVNHEVECAISGNPPEAGADSLEWHRRAEEWELLFQTLDFIGDCSLYYMIRRSDLLEGSFQKAWWVVQCT